MRGIILKESIKLFGFKSGLGFWFRWIFFDPIKIFYWKYISGKPLCTKHGYFLCKPDCNAKKIYGRVNIFNYEKERHKQIEKEAKIIRGSENGICIYCGEEKGTEIIDDPNWDTLERWLVCKNCEEIIKLQREMAFPLISIKRQEEINNRLLEISQRTGKPILNAYIEKDKEGHYHLNKIIFTGEKNGR